MRLGTAEFLSQVRIQEYNTIQNQLNEYFLRFQQLSSSKAFKNARQSSWYFFRPHLNIQTTLCDSFSVSFRVSQSNYIQRALSQEFWQRSEFLLPLIVEKRWLLMSLELLIYLDLWLAELLTVLDLDLCVKTECYQPFSGMGKRSLCCWMTILHIAQLNYSLYNRVISQLRIAVSLGDLIQIGNLQVCLKWYGCLNNSSLLNKRRIQEYSMNQQKASSLSRRSRSSKTKRKLLKKQLYQKQNGFVLDCLNAQKSKLKVYHSISDKNLNYFVIRAHPNFKRPKQAKSVLKTQKVQKLNHTKFQQLLQKEKEKILSPKNNTIGIQSQPSPLSECTLNQGDQKAKDRLLEQIKRSIKYKAKQTEIKQQGSYAEDSP